MLEHTHLYNIATTDDFRKEPIWRGLISAASKGVQLITPTAVSTKIQGNAWLSTCVRIKRTDGLLDILRGFAHHVMPSGS